jgi:ABC-type branched-subunit amino acid transport system ATPase component
MLLEIDGISRDFGGVRALDGVGFGVEQGAIHGLIGPNGAGKTTLLNVLSGITPPSGGKIKLDGQEIQGLPPHRVAGLGVARTFQHIRLFQGLSCLDNLIAGQHLKAPRPLLPRLLNLPAAAREEAYWQGQALEILELVGLMDRAETMASALSYGERRRLEIARALASRPRLLLLDEPVAGMRAESLDKVAAVIRALARGGMTILLIEHNMAFVMGLCSAITVLNFGRVITSGSPAEVSCHPQVVEAYLGPGVVCHA